MCVLADVERLCIHIRRLTLLELKMSGSAAELKFLEYTVCGFQGHEVDDVSIQILYQPFKLLFIPVFHPFPSSCILSELFVSFVCKSFFEET